MPHLSSVNATPEYSIGVELDLWNRTTACLEMQSTPIHEIIPLYVGWLNSSSRHTLGCRCSRDLASCPPSSRLYAGISSPSRRRPRSTSLPDDQIRAVQQQEDMPCIVVQKDFQKNGLGMPPRQTVSPQKSPTASQSAIALRLGDFLAAIGKSRILCAKAHHWMAASQELPLMATFLLLQGCFAVHSIKSWPSCASWVVVSSMKYCRVRRWRTCFPKTYIFPSKLKIPQTSGHTKVYP
jgi:hypothetical protein